MVYRPTFRSFIGSSLYRLSPIIVVAATWFFMAESFNALAWIAAAGVSLVSIWAFLPCIPVHLLRLHMDDTGVAVSSPFGAKAMRWSDVISARLLERRNAMSRTDHYLILQSRENILGFNTSTLSVSDEQDVLDVVRSRTRLVVESDRPTL